MKIFVGWIYTDRKVFISEGMVVKKSRAMWFVGCVMFSLSASDHDSMVLLKLCSPSPILPEERDFENKKCNRFNGYGKNLKGANFKKCSLKNADFRGAFLQEAHFEGADLSGAQFNGAYLHGIYVDDETCIDSKTDFRGICCSFITIERLRSFFLRFVEAEIVLGQQD